MRRRTDQWYGPVLDGLRAWDFRIRARRTGPRRILFDLPHPLSEVCAAPVIARLTGRGHRVRVTGPVPDDPALRPLRIHPGRAVWMGWDVLVFPDRPRHWYRRWARSCYLHHGSGSGGNGRSFAVELSARFGFDLLLSPGAHAARFEREAIAAAGLHTTVLEVGFPKLDALAQGRFDRNATLRELGLDPALPTVLVCSHWTPEGLLPTLGAELVEALAAGDYNLLVGGHPRLWTDWARERLGPAWYDRLDAATSQPGIRAVRSADVRPYLAAADVLVTDHSSVSLEYTVLGRPIVLFRHPDWRGADQALEDLLCRATRPVRSIAETVSAVREALGHGCPAAPLAELAAYCHTDPGGAADRAAAAIESLGGRTGPRAGTPPAPRAKAAGSSPAEGTSGTGSAPPSGRLGR